MPLIEETKGDASVSAVKPTEPIEIIVTDSKCSVRCSTVVSRGQKVTFRLDNRSTSLTRVVVNVVNDRHLLRKNGSRRNSFTLSPQGAPQETFTIDPDAADGPHQYTVKAHYQQNESKEADCAESLYQVDSQEQGEDLAIASTEGRSTRPIPPSMIVQD